MKEDKYFQPEFYRFDEDSIFLVDFILQSKSVNFENNNQSFLEVGAGCGVISIELLNRLYLLSDIPKFNMELIELQLEFKQSLEKNLSFLESSINISVHFEDFLFASRPTKYSCVYSNPPYFFKNEGRLSSNLFREKCRRMMKEDLDTWLKKMIHFTKVGGDIFFCHRSSTIKSSLYNVKECKKVKRKKSTFYWWTKVN